MFYKKEFISSNTKLSVSLKTKVILLVFMFCITAGVKANPLGYDIVYVRYPGVDPNGSSMIEIAQGEQPYKTVGGADLVLLKADGTQIILVDCDISCSVTDPNISIDGTTVYYSMAVGTTTDRTHNFSVPSWLYKMNLTDGNYTPIRLTYDDGFDSDLYGFNTTPQHNHGNIRGVRDMSPVPLADGRLLFTSNRAATIMLDPDAIRAESTSIQHLYIMDDHDGSLNTDELSNLRQFDNSALMGVQHPMQLQDGRILFSSWQSVGHRERYGMTSLFTIYPDGTNIMQFTEPHERAKHLEHFITQLPNEDVVSGYYYPSFDFGFGVLLKYPIKAASGRDWQAGGVAKIDKQFSRKGTITLTPHTTPQDQYAPNRSGKYSMPSVGANGSLLTAYSTGYVNYQGATCREIVGVRPDRCENLKSGIYMIPNASTNIVTDPTAGLVKVLDDLEYNELWPRAVLSYQQLHGVPAPAIIPMDRSNTTGATAIMGTSSTYNRESAPKAPWSNNEPDPFQYNGGRIYTAKNWRLQGADAGVYTDEEMYGVRIIGTPQKPYSAEIDSALALQMKDFLPDSRIKDPSSAYVSFHGERWEILGEFPFTNRATIDAQGNPDTSWSAVVPAETPLLIQTIDSNGMTLNSELTWRALKAGEKRVDCGGCHAHSVEPLDYATTQSAAGAPITGVAGILDNDFRIAGGRWNLTTGAIPLMTENGTEFVNQRVLGVEFRRDVYPILQNDCLACHTTASGTLPNFEGDSTTVYDNLTNSLVPEVPLHARYAPTKAEWGLPNMSRFVKSMQARQSLLTWVVYGERLDGRLDSTRDDDLDYPTAHPALNLADTKKRTIARWIDLGGAMDYPNDLDTAYTKDLTLPVVDRVYLNPKPAQYAGFLSVGMHDADSGLNLATLVVNYSLASNPEAISIVNIDKPAQLDTNDVVHINVAALPITDGVDYIIRVSVEDNVGNKNIYHEKLTKGAVIL